MFRKPVALSGEHAVSGSDRKKLRRALAAALGADNATLDALLPAKADLRVAKLAPPSRASLYTCDGAPWLLDRSGKGDYLPCLPALWRAPALLRRLTLRHADVARFLLGGADLMLPGVALPAAQLASLREGELAAAFVPGNPAAVAVGAVALSGAEAAARMPPPPTPPQSWGRCWRRPISTARPARCYATALRGRRALLGPPGH